MARLFGTDGVRGVANKNLSAKLAFDLGYAGAKVLTQQLCHKPKILVGKDTRISGDMLECALAAGICQTGAQAIFLGVIPTPAVAHLVRKYNADAGVVISASHNSFEYNGIKFFNSQGYKLSDETEDKIEYLIKNPDESDFPTHENIGRCVLKTDSADDYIEYAKSTIDGDLKGLSIILDCSNGANSYIAPKALKELGASVEVLHNDPDGININKNCGSTHISDLANYIASKPGSYDIGIAFDGDADRMLAVDENGKTLTGDEIMLIVGNHLKKQGLLKKDTIVATVMSNLGFFKAAEKLGINVEKTAVGDRYVLEEMLRSGYCLGGEESGHIIYLDRNSTGDGLVSALLLLSVMKDTKQKLSELRKIVTILPQVLVNAHVENEKKPELKSNKVILSAIEELEEEFKDSGRVLIRPSGTEPVVRVMLEGNDKAYLQKRAEQLAFLIEKTLK